MYNGTMYNVQCYFYADWMPGNTVPLETLFLLRRLDAWIQRSLGYTAGQEHARGNSSSRTGAQIEAALTRLQIGLTASEFSAKGLTVREVPLN